MPVLTDLLTEFTLRRLALPYVSLDGPLLHEIVIGEPVGQGRISTFGRGRSAHSNEKQLLPWRASIGYALRNDAAQRGLELPISGPLLVNLVFTRRRPLSAPKKRRIWPTTRPDLDHYERAVLDAATGAGIWHDDGQVVALVSAKVYPDARHALHGPGLSIDIYRVLEEPAAEPAAELCEDCGQRVDAHPVYKVPEVP